MRFNQSSKAVDSTLICQQQLLLSLAKIADGVVRGAAAPTPDLTHSVCIYVSSDARTQAPDQMFNLYVNGKIKKLFRSLKKQVQCFFHGSKTAIRFFAHAVMICGNCSKI